MSLQSPQMKQVSSALFLAKPNLDFIDYKLCWGQVQCLQWGILLCMIHRKGLGSSKKTLQKIIPNFTG